VRPPKTTAVRVIAIVVAVALGTGIGVGARHVLNDDDGGGGGGKTTPVSRSTALPAGRYASKRFPSVRSLTVSAGWRLDKDAPAVLEVSRARQPLGSIGFDRPTQVFEDRFVPTAAAMSTSATVRPLPDDLAAFFASIPEVQVFPSNATQLDGVAAETFAVLLKPLPPENRNFCNGQIRCMFWGRRGTQLFALFENDVTAFTVVRTRGETLVIAAAAPQQGGEAFGPLVNEVLRTVKLRRG
jgi:hypothetical protein